MAGKKKRDVKWEQTRLTRFFDRLFKDPEYAFLNPDAGGANAEAHGGRGQKGQRGEVAGGGSLSVALVSMGNDLREGRLDASGRVIVNMDHPLFIKYANVPLAKNQRVALVITTVLLKNAASKREMGAEEALDIQGRVLNMAKDSMW